VIVEARFYDEDGNELGIHDELTPEIESGETWRFEIASIAGLMGLPVTTLL